MGSDKHYPEERPAHRVTVDGFWIDRVPVTNERFGTFVERTRHVTFAEIPPKAEDYPGALPDSCLPGHWCSSSRTGRVDTRDITHWWHWMQGADWRHPHGPASGLDGLEQHPVVHVTLSDAEAFAQWEGKTLPTEAEWERAARGGLDGAAYAWGDEFLPNDRHLANTWQGEFPWENRAADGYEGTSPVGVFPPNGYGLFDMIGNVWEWTIDWYRAQASGRGREDLLHSSESERRTRGGQLRSARRNQGPAKSGQGRLAPVCAELLPPLSAGGTSSAAH